MSTIAEHNNLIKICFDGSKHLKHIMTVSEGAKTVAVENRYPLTRLPVCGGCERLAYWHHNKTAWCKHCGTVTQQPITYANYLACGYDIDATGATAKLVLDKERQKREIILPSYGE